MIEKIKKIKKNILYYSIALIIILIVVHLLLTILNLKFRLWVYFTVILVSIIGLIIGIIQKLKSISSKTKKIIGIICGSILIISIIFKLPMLGLLSIFNISGCSGDLVMFFFFLTRDKDIMYTELDDPTKFAIITEKEMKSTKWLGLKFIESDNYTEDILKISDHRRIVISTFSKIFMIISLVICILLLGFYI